MTEDQMAAMRDILIDLTNSNPCDPHGQDGWEGACALCGANEHYEPTGHWPACPYRRARELLDALVTPLTAREIKPTPMDTGPHDQAYWDAVNHDD